MVLNRTWPYGTRKRAEVRSIERSIVVLVDEDNEGHMLIGTDHWGRGLGVGDKVEIEFTKGGPTGGYWKIAE